jgi:tetratricopeptide (TPR) repeat protein
MTLVKRSLQSGDVLKVLGDRKGSLEGFSNALVIFESLSAADPENANASRSLLIIDVKMGDALADNGRPEEVGTFYRKTLAIRERLAAADTASVQARRDLLESLTGLEKFAAAAARADEARESLSGQLEQIRNNASIQARPHDTESRRVISGLPARAQVERLHDDDQQGQAYGQDRKEVVVDDREGELEAMQEKRIVHRVPRGRGSSPHASRLKNAAFARIAFGERRA